ncbi:hypothetical protein BDZ97DRAFT_1778713 [Flammula alnicola]|nr:hypothetical protein BDZ97DRAFT_1778713 [Flammula alnicola]
MDHGLQQVCKLESKRFLVLRECSLIFLSFEVDGGFLLIFYFAFLGIFGFRECSWVHRFARGSVLEYWEAVRACAMHQSTCVGIQARDFHS